MRPCQQRVAHGRHGIRVTQFSVGRTLNGGRAREGASHASIQKTSQSHANRSDVDDGTNCRGEHVNMSLENNILVHRTVGGKNKGIDKYKIFLHDRWLSVF